MKYVFGVVSDTHIGCEASRLDLLNKIYAEFKKRGVKIVLHAGDVIDGTGIYRGQEDFLIDHTWQKQAMRVIDKYPRIPGITTYFITGNHDLGKNQGFDPASIITTGYTYEDSTGHRFTVPGRDDLVYIGKYKRRIILPGKFTVDLLHGDKGGGANRAGPPTKIVKSIPYWDMPQLLILGHFHYAEHLRIAGIHAIMPGCFQDETEFSVRKGLAVELGGWIVEYEMENGQLTRFRPEFIQYPNSGRWTKDSYKIE